MSHTMDDFGNMNRRQFLRWMGVGAGTTVLNMGLPFNLLAAADPDQNPLAGQIDRNWEKIYRDQYKYDSFFDWVCSPNDTHACRVRAYVRNGIVTRMGATYDYQNYSDLYGNHATNNWNPRQCAKGYTFLRNREIKSFHSTHQSFQNSVKAGVIFSTSDVAESVHLPKRLL